MLPVRKGHFMMGPAFTPAPREGKTITGNSGLAQENLNA